MASLASLRQELEALKAAAGKNSQVMPWEIPGLGEYRQAKTRQKLLQKITGAPAVLAFDPEEYGHTLEYFENWNLKAFDYYRDRPADPVRDARIRRDLAAKLLTRINAAAYPAT